jgi:hypothetical protein
VPKRIVDGEALWLSDKIRKLPEQYRIHYANWIPLAEANGVFEADPARIQARVYAYILPAVTPNEVSNILKEFVNVGLVRLWEDEGKSWGYFVGIDKGGRLPDLRHLSRYKNLPPAPPMD